TEQERRDPQREQHPARNDPRERCLAEGEAPEEGMHGPMIAEPAPKVPLAAPALESPTKSVLASWGHPRPRDSRRIRPVPRGPRDAPRAPAVPLRAVLHGDGAHRAHGRAQRRGPALLAAASRE